MRCIDQKPRSLVPVRIGGFSQTDAQPSPHCRFFYLRLPLTRIPFIYNNDFKIRATERKGHYPLSIECDHRSSKPREGDLGHHASQGRLRFGQHPFGHGQGSMLPRYATSLWLTSIKDNIANQQDYVDLALFCAHVCNALERGLEGRQLDELSRSVLGAIDQLTA